MKTGVHSPCCSVRCPQRSCAESAETADATASVGSTASRAIDYDDFACVRPIVGLSHNPRAHGIVAHVVPFLSIALVAPQQVVVKSRLPERAQLLASHGTRALSGSSERHVQMPLQTFNPVAQPDTASDAESDKQMDVVGHDDVAADRHFELRRAPAILNESTVHFISGKESLPLKRIEGHEEERRVETLKNQPEPRRFTLNFPLHDDRCSVRCPQRISDFRSAEDSGRYSTSRATEVRS